MRTHARTRTRTRTRARTRAHAHTLQTNAHTRTHARRRTQMQRHGEAWRVSRMLPACRRLQAHDAMMGQRCSRAHHLCPCSAHACRPCPSGPMIRRPSMPLVTPLRQGRADRTCCDAFGRLAAAAVPRTWREAGEGVAREVQGPQRPAPARPPRSRQPLRRVSSPFSPILAASAARDAARPRRVRQRRQQRGRHGMLPPCRHAARHT